MYGAIYLGKNNPQLPNYAGSHVSVSFLLSVSIVIEVCDWTEREPSSKLVVIELMSQD